METMLISLHAVSIIMMGLSYWNHLGTHIKLFGITLLFPVYLAVISIALSNKVYDMRDQLDPLDPYLGPRRSL